MSRPSLLPLFICLLLYIGSFLNVTRQIELKTHQFLFPLVSPFISIKTTLNNIVADLRNLPQYKTQISKLESDLEHQRVINKTFFDKLKDQETLSTLTSKSWTTTPARLISIDNLAILSATNLSDIKAGQPVISGETLVGLIQTVEAPIIKVLPLTHLDVRINVQTDTNIHGQYLYKNNRPTVTNIPSESAFNPQATIFTLPSEQIPENLIIGTIDQVITNPAAPSQEVSLKLSKNLTESSNLLIITKP